MHFANSSIHIYFSSGIEFILDHPLIKYNAIPSTSLLNSADKDHASANMVIINAVNTTEDDEDATPDISQAS